MRSRAAIVSCQFDILQWWAQLVPWRRGGGVAPSARKSYQVLDRRFFVSVLVFFFFVFLLVIIIIIVGV